MQWVRLLCCNKRHLPRRNMGIGIQVFITWWVSAYASAILQCINSVSLLLFIFIIKLKYSNAIELGGCVIVPGFVVYAFDLGYADWLYVVVLIVCLNPEEFKEFKLVKRTQLSHNVAKFRFELPTPTSVLGLPIGQHISCRFGWLNYSHMPVVFGLCFHHVCYW